jgi:hypothetical protein
LSINFPPTTAIDVAKIPDILIHHIGFPMHRYFDCSHMMKCLVLFLFLAVSIDAFMVPKKASFRTRILMKAQLAEESLEPLLSVAILDDDTPGVSQVEFLNIDFDKSKVPSVAVVDDEREKVFVIADAVQEEIFVIDKRDAAILSLQDEIQLKEDQYQELMVQLKEEMQ